MRRVFFIIIIFIITLITIGLYRASEQVTDVNNKRIYDGFSKTISLLVKDAKEQSLTIALSLSTNPKITNTLLQKDKKEAHKALQYATNQLKEYLHKDSLYAQVVTKEYEILARSWESPPHNSQKDLLALQLKDLSQPVSDFDVDRFLGIKSTVPIVVHKEIIGYLQITTMFDEIVDKLRDLYSVELIPLMDKRFQTIATLMSKNTEVADYIVASGNSNKNLTNRLTSFPKKDLDTLIKTGILEKGSLVFISFPIKTSKNERLGEFVSAMSTQKRAKYLKEDQNFLERIFTINTSEDDIFKVINTESYSGYNNLDLDVFLKLTDPNEDRENMLVTNSLKKRLETLSKEELIDIITQENSKRKITGEIR